MSIMQASFTLRGHNPDVLTCIANLSNDEVFTPPEFANQMLDTLAAAWADANDGADIWADPSVTFLDPFTKSGVFLREIVRRLTDGLILEIPDLAERVDHVLTKQVFGIGITQLTALLARRSVYCSKFANGPHSIAKSFTTEDGNIWFERTEHTWGGGKREFRVNPLTSEEITVYTNRKCIYCGASEDSYARGDDLETHAYAFIHTDDIKARIAELFGDHMQFDVIIGNPPYQLGSDGGTRDVPIYQHFVEQAKLLEPRFLTMVIPSRWMATGLGLNDFRRTMLNDTHIRNLVDYPNAAEVFSEVGINGGACYFLWDVNYDGACEVTSVWGGEKTGPERRQLNEFDILVRDARALPILRKVIALNEPSVNSILARDKEFGWTSNFTGFHDSPKTGDVPIYYIKSMRRQVGYIARSEVAKSQELVDTWKLLVPEVGSGREREKTGVDLVLGPSLIAPPPSVCTQSFLFFHAGSEDEIRSIRSYYATRFFRFLVSLRKITQHATHSTYQWVPMQPWDREWTDTELYEKYGLTEAEISYIESRIRPMVLADE
jgi:site-specific DNA-methyltransferase (adenine-specific)